MPFETAMAELPTTAGDKRPRGSPTGDTPLQKQKEQRVTRETECSKARRRLPFGNTADSWSESEESALVEFILLHRPGTRWPADKDKKFWDGAATFVRDRSESTMLRTG